MQGDEISGNRADTKLAVDNEPGRTAVDAGFDEKTILDTLPDLIAVIDPAHEILHLNRAMAQRLGVEADQCRGLKCYKCIHGLDAPPDCCPHLRTLADGRQHTAEIHEQRLGGDFLVTCIPLFDREAQMFGTVHVARDISERKCANDEMAQNSKNLIN